MRPPLANERGLSLVEILVASTIISIGLVGVMTVVPISSYGLQEGKQRSTATFLAEQRLEAVRNATWTANPASDCLGLSPSSSDAPTSTTCPGHAGTFTTFPDEASVPGFTDYSRTARVTNCGAPPGCGGVTDAGMRLVTVGVTYRPVTAAEGVAPGAARSVTLDLLVAKR